MAERFVSLQSLMRGTEVPILREGVPSFFGMPVAHTPRELAGADVAVIGIPAGTAASPGRRSDEWSGFEEAPANVRRHSIRYGGYLPELDLDAFEHVSVVDYGDAEIVPGDPERSIDKVARKVREVLEAGCRLITLGGCVPAANYAVIKGMATSTSGRVGVISLDAHGDCMPSFGTPGSDTKPVAGTWQARMWERYPNIDGTRHVEIGMRGPRNLRKMVEMYREKGAHWYPAARVREMGIAAVCREALPFAFDGTARAWFSLDMDVLDIGALPDWGDEPIGLSSLEVMTTVHEAGKSGVDALSFQFVAPRSAAAASVVGYTTVYLLAGWVLGGWIKAGC